MLHIRLITISNKPPAWLSEGFREYSKRLSALCHFELLEIPLEKRKKQSLIEREGEKILAAIKPQSTVIALAVQGKSFSTEALASHLETWLQAGKNLDFIIGGPEGLAAGCLQRAELRWSLSPLTLPHLFARLLLAEQLYRAFMILQNHPYHK